MNLDDETRRRFLRRGGAVALVWMAGCTSDSSGGNGTPSGRRSPTDTSETTVGDGATTVRDRENCQPMPEAPASTPMPEAELVDTADLRFGSDIGTVSSSETG